MCFYSLGILEFPSVFYQRAEPAIVERHQRGIVPFVTSHSTQAQSVKVVQAREEVA